MDDKNIEDKIEQNIVNELEQFKKQKEQIRKIMGQIGGIKDAKKDKFVNIIFIILILILFAFDILRFAFEIEVHLPPLVSLELGILLISLKIIYMMHKQTKLEHFQFWILNSLEFRMNDIQQKLNDLDKKTAD